MDRIQETSAMAVALGVTVLVVFFVSKFLSSLTAIHWGIFFCGIIFAIGLISILVASVKRKKVKK